MTTVVLLCGVAGSGKTRYARERERGGSTRLSLDEYRWRTGCDAEHAERELRAQLVNLMMAGRNVVLDYRFPRRALRDDYKELVERHGAQWELVYLKANPQTLRDRLAVRNTQSGPNAVPVSARLLADYLAGFEEPCGEGEQVIWQR